MFQLTKLPIKQLLLLITSFIFCFNLAAQQEDIKKSPVSTDQPAISATQENTGETPTSSETPADESSSLADKKSTIVKPIDFLQQQQEDIKHYLEPDTIKPILVGMKEHITLLNLNKTGVAKGVMILLPDWQQNATGSNSINFLRKQLPKKGWTTITIQPLTKPDNYPSQAIEREKKIEDNKKALIDYQDEMGLLLKQINEKAKDYPGVIVIIAEGSNGALLTNIYQQEIVELPTALILLSSFLPTMEDNKTVAASITQLPIPVLDLLLSRDNRYVEQAAQLRADAVKQEMKPYYRQKKIHNITPNHYPTDSLLKEINGWLSSVGW
ncbi:DUF3530 family protein [Thalassotalea piscium]